MKEVEKLFVERRGWPRAVIGSLIDEAVLTLPNQSPERAPRAEVVNLSEAGAGVLTPVELKKGTAVKLQIFGRNIPQLVFEAEVRWTMTSPVSTGKFPVGLKFMNLDQKGKTALLSFIEVLRKHRPKE
ncbi:PilZ domain-containing protein [Candidatus Poribacteria bacterium]|nr:PilZ domain-containing protein [Candidatus Poribacteria bacterium]